MQSSLSEVEKLLAIHQEGIKGLVEFYRLFLSDDEYSEPADFHYTISDVLLKGNKNYAIEMFRESAKSTYVLKTFPLYRLTYPDPDSRYIVLIKNNQTLADAKLREIVEEYRNNKVLNKNLLSINKSSSSIFEVEVIGLDGKPVVMRIEAYGKGASIRGLSWGNLRPQMVVCDDLQDTQDAISESVTEKDWDWFLSDINFLSKKGRIVIIGNNLGERCVIERIIDNKSLEYETTKIPVLNEKGESNWPSAFPVDFIQKERDQFTSLGKIDIWYRERMCIAIPEETRIFKREYFRYFEEVDALSKDLDFYVTVDLAISEKKSADESVICVVGKQANKPEWYIMEFVAGRMNPLEVIDALFMIQNKYRPLRVGIESVAYQKSLLYFIEEEQRKRQTYFAIQEIRTNKNKEEKIKGLQPMFKTGVIFHRRSMTKLEEQLLSFPKGLHDDYIDALAMQMDVMQNTARRQGPRKTYDGGYRDPLKTLKY